MADSIDALVHKLSNSSNPKFVNRFRTLVCLMHELGLSAAQVRNTKYWRWINGGCAPNAMNGLIEYSLHSDDEFVKVKERLKEASEQRKRSNTPSAGINVRRILMSYANVLWSGDDATIFDLDRLPVATIKKKGYYQQQYRKALKMLDDLKPYIEKIIAGDAIYHEPPFAPFCDVRGRALIAYSRIIYGAKKPSILEREALMLLPGKRRTENSFMSELESVKDENERKWKIFSYLKNAYR